MKPGETIRPSASSVRAAGVVTRPISTMRPSETPMSAAKRGLPEPSTTVPPRITRSSAMTSSLEARNPEAFAPSRSRHGLARTVDHQEGHFRELALALEDLKGPGTQHQLPGTVEGVTGERSVTNLIHDTVLVGGERPPRSRWLNGTGIDHDPPESGRRPAACALDPIPE